MDLIIIIAIWLLFPFYWAINSSFKSENQLSMMPATFIHHNPMTKRRARFTLRNYESVFTIRHSSAAS